MYAVTGASGQLGRLVIDALLDTVQPAEVVGLVRVPAKMADLAGRGVVVRPYDYDRPETLALSLAGVDRLLLISSSEVGSRLPQHQAVIDAAKAAGVGYIAYTSITMASNDTTTVLDEANKAAVRIMLKKLTDHDVAEVYNAVGGQGPIGDLAADAMQAREIDL